MAITLLDAYLGFEGRIATAPISADAQGLYLRLLYYANQQREIQADGSYRFPALTYISSQTLMCDLAVKDKKTFRKIRDELVTAGYIEVKAGVGKTATAYDLKISNGEQTAPPSPKKRREKTSPSGSSFDTDEFFYDAVFSSLGGEFSEADVKKLAEIQRGQKFPLY